MALCGFFSEYLVFVFFLVMVNYVSVCIWNHCIAADLVTFEYYCGLWNFIFSDKGTVYSARAYKISECSRTAAGTPLVQVFCCPLFSLYTLTPTHPQTLAKKKNLKK